MESSPQLNKKIVTGLISGLLMVGMIAVPYLISMQLVFGSIDSPKKQMARGVAAKDVVCKEGLTLVISGKSIAVCVKSSTAMKLVERGYGTLAKVAMEETRPNILIILADDFGYTDLATFGGGDISMPNVDELAKEGVVFTNYHSLPTCSPTRSVLLSGVDNHINGLGTMHELLVPNQKGKIGYETYITDRVVSIADLFNDAGYHTYLSGKWHLGTDDGYRPYDKGFEEVFALLQGSANNFDEREILPDHPSVYYRNNEMVHLPDNFFSSDYYTDTMIDFIKKNHGDGKPMFMYLSFNAVHWPLQAPQKYIQKYEGKYDIGWDKLRETRFEHMKELGIIPEDFGLPDRHPKVPAWDSLTPEEQRYEAKKMALYAAMADNMDYNAGRLLNYLKEIGEYDNTFIIFSTDNGAESTDLVGAMEAALASEEYSEWVKKFDNSIENMGNANSNISYGPGWAQVGNTPFRNFKGFVSEGGIRVPLIVKVPNMKIGIRTNEFVSVLDLAPTFLDYAGIKHPASSYKGKEIHPPMGKSIRPLLEGKSERIYGEGEYIAFELFGNKALLMGDWKIVQLNEPFGDGKWRLYNTNQDPSELNDLSEQEPELMQKMISLYEKYAEDVGVIPPEGFTISPWVFISEE